MNKIIRTIIVDDDDQWRELVKIRIESHPMLELVGSFDSAYEAHTLIISGAVDLMLLDIEMPDGNGMEFYKRLIVKPFVIFITSHRDFAIESYENNAMDYLIKPLTTARFLQAIEKVISRLTNEKNNKVVNIDSLNDHIFVRENNRFIKVEIDKILFLKALENYVQIITSDKIFVTLLSLKAIEGFFPSSQFQKVNRSHIINLKKITSISAEEVLIEEHVIPISKNYSDLIINSVVKSKLIGRSV